jgi:hypothetical protein
MKKLLCQQINVFRRYDINKQTKDSRLKHSWFGQKGMADSNGSQPPVLNSVSFTIHIQPSTYNSLVSTVLGAKLCKQNINTKLWNCPETGNQKLDINWM